MKANFILFSEPDVFSVLPEWPKDNQPKFCVPKCFSTVDLCGCDFQLKCYNIACEQSKANAIRIENPELIYDVTQHGNLLYFGTHLKHGDIFQVEGFEYELETKYVQISRGFSYKKDGSDEIKSCDLVKDGIGYYADGKVAILKLAKEEEPKECSQLRHDENGILYCGKNRKSCECWTDHRSYNQAIDDVLKNQALLIQNCFLAIENGGAEYYPFDGHTLESLGGMKRAYSHAMEEIKKLKK